MNTAAPSACVIFISMDHGLRDRTVFARAILLSQARLHLVEIREAPPPPTLEMILSAFPEVEAIKMPVFTRPDREPWRRGRPLR